jgi:hypothetical protein
MSPFLLSFVCRRLGHWLTLGLGLFMLVGCETMAPFSTLSDQQGFMLLKVSVVGGHPHQRLVGAHVQMAPMGNEPAIELHHGSEAVHPQIPQVVWLKLVLPAGQQRVNSITVLTDQPDAPALTAEINASMHVLAGETRYGGGVKITPPTAGANGAVELDSSLLTTDAAPWSAVWPDLRISGIHTDQLQMGSRPQVWHGRAVGQMKLKLTSQLALTQSSELPPVLQLVAVQAMAQPSALGTMSESSAAAAQGLSATEVREHAVPSAWRNVHRQYVRMPSPKAFAFAPNGGYSAMSDRNDVINKALKQCQQMAKGVACRLLAVDETWLLPVDVLEPMKPVGKTYGN